MRAMSRAGRFAFLFFLAGALSSCITHGKVRIMPLGASYTAGLTVTSDGTHIFAGGYRRKLEALLDADHVDFDFVGSQTDPASAPTLRKHHEGHPGWRIDNIDDNVEQFLHANPADVVLLLVGTNDILQNYHLAHAPERLDHLVGHLLRIHPVKWVLVASLLPLGNPVLNAEVNAFNHAAEPLIQARENKGQKVIWVDLNHCGVTPSEEADQVHPNAAGYDQVAQYWYDYLRLI